MNVGASCIYVNMRDSNYKMTCIVKKKKQIGEQEQVQSALFPGHTLLVRSFMKCILSFSLFTIQNASPMIASENSRVHLVSLLMINKPTN